MRAYLCPHCDSLLDLLASSCRSCNTAIGFALGDMTVVALDDDTDWVRCSEYDDAGCNWLVHPSDDPRCEACRLTRSVARVDGQEEYQYLLRVEAAIKRLVYQLTDLGLPIVNRFEDPNGGLAFDLPSSRHGPVTIGHANGVITLDLAESNDAHREMLRHQLSEPYRTVLGHVRHEVGHYYWTVLIDNDGRTDAFRARFGDERQSYQDALTRHYHQGPPEGWPANYVSAYATMHPWEDWAETFAHYLHVRDALQTAHEYGIAIDGPIPVSAIGEDATGLNVREWIFAREWSRFIAAFNAVNRSMGHGDLYPFDLSAPALTKLAFVHDIVRGADG